MTSDDLVYRLLSFEVSNAKFQVIDGENWGHTMLYHMLYQLGLQII